MIEKILITDFFWNFIHTPKWFYTSAAAIFGACLASFLNVVVYRLPKIQKGIPFNLSTPRSHCPICKTEIPWYRNIPILTWCIQKGKCHFCHTRIPAQYVLIEFGGFLLAGLVAYCSPIALLWIYPMICVLFPIPYWFKKKWTTRQYFWIISFAIITLIMGFLAWHLP